MMNCTKLCMVPQTICGNKKHLLNYHATQDEAKIQELFLDSWRTDGNDVRDKTKQNKTGKSIDSEKRRSRRRKKTTLIKACSCQRQNDVRVRMA